MAKFQIDVDLNVAWQDAGVWRSYQLIAEGDSIDALVENAIIEEIDQDGGTLNHYGIEDASNEVSKTAFKRLTKLVEGK